ncbi:MAG: hypothetical protein ABI595_14705 [Actinomycetota bacterium]
MDTQRFAATKDASIRTLLRAVGSEAIATKVDVVDHWDADRHAIGFHRVGASEPLLYVSTLELPKGSYRWTLETKPGRSAEAGTVRSTKALADLLERHLLVDAGSSGKVGHQKRKARTA